MNLIEQMAFRDAFLNYLASDIDTWADKVALIQKAQIALSLPPLLGCANSPAIDYSDPIRERT